MEDKSVVLWSIHDHISTLATDSENGGKRPKSGTDDKPTECPKIQARGIFKGHDDTVEDIEKAHSADLHCVDWNPIDENFILTGLIFNGVGSPIHIFTNHSAAVLCVQWSPNKSSVFGCLAEDGVLNIWDHNKVGERTGPASKFTPVLSLWSHV
ncbi:WD40 repeat-containing protein MSI4-like protein [Tanacetum coccineum]